VDGEAGERRCHRETEAVAQVVYSAGALETLQRALETSSAIAQPIRSAVGNLASHPLVGRRIGDELRELVISYGATGHIALYRFDVRRDQVRILALRHQRDIGYLP
jgi:plasmid stabilization system protein ParE